MCLLCPATPVIGPSEYGHCWPSECLSCEEPGPEGILT